MEDFSGCSSREERELLNCNVVARITALMSTLISRLKNCYKDPSHADLHSLDPLTSHGLALFSKCLVILSNLSANNPDARKEILKFKLLDLLAASFELPLVQQSLETLKNLAYLLRNVT